MRRPRTAEPLPPLAALVYRWSLDHGGVSAADRPTLAAELDGAAEEVERALDALRALGLLVPTAGALVPASPDSAVAELITPIELEIKELEHYAGDLTAQVHSLRAMYFESRRERNRREAVDVIEGQGRVRSLLDAYARRCTSEILSAHPGTTARAETEAWLPRSPGPERGVRVRTLFQHPVRASHELRELLDELSDEGCEVRTGDELPDRIVIFDRETAFLPSRAAQGGAVVVREPSTVDFLHRAVEQSWSTAVSYEARTATADRYGNAGDELKRAIIHLLAAGAKDEHIARRLSISVRTCRRHIAEIMLEMRASSRFQAGVNVLRSGLLSTAGYGDAFTADDPPGPAGGPRGLAGAPGLADVAG
ncbi:LuxR C-terminal-related transcriptional regulator [Streptomyces sp. NPDC035033]|uniref:LuxR C-terminal-related transcriptional regulator n=1 Tax=Streptomyces sp. NPDC035033 TaxID=3155368 RepID=UPI0033FC43A4